ncbi:protein BatD [bacterium]|nr:MAG: protein BatD [bacterium]
MKLHLLAYLALTVLFTNLAIAQDAQFTAAVSANPVVQGEPFRVQFSVNTDASNFRPPSFDGFEVLNGPSQSSSMQIINGQYSQSLSFTYVLKANSVGTLTIQPASIQVNGKRVRSNSIDLRVVEPSQAEKERRKQAADQEKSLQGQANDIIKNNIYLRTNVSKTSAYVGEELTANFKLYVNGDLNVVGLEMESSPILNGFWSQEIDLGQMQWQREQVNGVWFRVATLKQVVLFPQQSGKLTIDPYKFKTVVRLQTNGQSNRRRSIFDDFFNRGSYKDFNYTLSSNPISVNVKPLPSGAPDGFNGAVGSYNMEAWVDNTKTVTNEPVTLKVKISGKGNLKLFDAPTLSLPSDMETFDPKTADNTKVSLAGMTGDKIFEFLVIPRTVGKYKIAPITFSYFDLKTDTYKTIKSDEFQIEVGKGSSDGASSISGVSREELQLLGKDIRYIKTETSLDKKVSSGLFGSQTFFILLMLPFFLFLLLFILLSKRKKESENTELMKNKRASKLAKKRLSSAGEALKQNNSNLFYEEITKSLWGYISDKLNIPVSELNKDVVRLKLAEINIDEAQINNFLKALEESEFARYSPNADSASKMNDIYNKSGEVITNIERGIR